MPSTLLDDAAATGETHVFAVAAVTAELPLIETIGGVRKDHAQIAQIRPFHLAVLDVPAIVGPAHHVPDGATVATVNLGAVLSEGERDWPPVAVHTTLRATSGETRATPITGDIDGRLPTFTNCIGAGLKQQSRGYQKSSG